MPVSHKIRTLRIGNFVCRSCLSKLIATERRKACYPRHFSGSSTLYSKGFRSQPDPTIDREIHFYDQTPDGNTRERFVDDKYEDQVRDTLTDESLKQTIEENASTMRKLFESSIPSEYDLDHDLANLEAEGRKAKEFTDRVDKAGKIENLSAEEREKLRMDLINSGLFDEPGEESVNSNMIPKPKECPEDNTEKSHPHQTIDEDESDRRFRSPAAPTTSRPISSTLFSDADNSQTSQIQQALERLPATKFPVAYQPNIISLQDCLRAYSDHRPSLHKKSKASKVTKDMIRSHLARSYMLARKGLLAAPKHVPSSLWNALWEIFETKSKGNINRLIYIRRLGEDMDEIGVSMSLSQRLVFIEALFIDGARKLAISHWQAAKPSQGNALWDEYWETGLRMLANVGRLEEAFAIAEAYFKDMRQQERYRALLPLIRACLMSKEEYSVQRAWALYLRLRFNLGNSMTMEDYDLVISWFMEAEKPELALAIFRDMMLTGDEQKNIYDSMALHKISGILSDFNGVKIEQTELEWKDTRALAALPSKFHNKFFFGSWIKKLIGDNELKSAEKVVDLMQDFGIRPSAMHINGLIGAWFRRGNKDDFTRADDLAWRMIKNRLETVHVRNYQHSLEKPLRPVLNGYSVRDKSAFLFPMATIETFALLVQQYRQHQRTDALSALFKAYIKSNIPPNTRYMNQIILTDTRNHKTSLAFETYRILTARGVKPDYETFILLWNLMKISVDPSTGRKLDKRFTHIGTCRQLFAEMIKWKPILTERQPFPRELYRLIILSFSLKQDQVGSAVALRGLQHEFGMFPDENNIRTIILQLARQGLRNSVGMKPRRLNLSLPMTQGRISCVTKFFSEVKNRRTEALLAKGINPEKMSNEAKREESLLLLIDVFQHVTVARLIGENRSHQNTAQVAAQAAEQMGVPKSLVWQAK